MRWRESWPAIGMNFAATSCEKEPEMKSTSHRPEQVADQIRMLVGEMLLRQLHDPRIGFTTVTAVKMSRDLRHARIYISVYGDSASRERTMDGLEAARGFIRREIGHQLNLRFTPEIVFEYDESVQYGAHIEEVLQHLKIPIPTDEEKKEK